MLLMELPATQTPETAAPSAEAPPRKSFWNIVHGATPVLLTILATVLAGLSSSEMTLAQYHRALAAQNQSKASDQWTFFQFKRTQQKETKTALDQMPVPSRTQRLNADWLREVTQQCLHDLQQARREAGQLSAVLSSAKSASSGNGEALQKAAAKLLAVATAQVEEAQALGKRLDDLLAREDVKQALGYLGADTLPPAQTSPLAQAEIQEALRAIAARKTIAETAPLIARVDEDTLQHEIDLAEGNVSAVENANKPVSAVLDEIERLILEQAQFGDDLYRSVRRVEHALANVPQADRPAPVRSAVEAVSRTGQALKTDARDLRDDFHANQYDYTVRRYEVETRHNQKAATLYEVEIRKASVASENHRKRSRNFFYGMLIAQAGVTIASFSLAMKYRSVLWSLATAAGITAVAFSGYIYLYMKPG
jgi:hypothetical protein